MMTVPNWMIFESGNGEDKYRASCTAFDSYIEAKNYFDRLIKILTEEQPAWKCSVDIMYRGTSIWNWKSKALKNTLEALCV